MEGEGASECRAERGGVIGRFKAAELDTKLTLVGDGVVLPYFALAGDVPRIRRRCEKVRAFFFFFLIQH